MKNKRISTVVILSLGAVLSLVACGKGSGSSSGSRSSSSSSGGSANVNYTYNTYLSTSPTNWNVHNWQTNDESYITSFTEMGLYDCILNSAKNGYEFVTEMAGDFPTSISPDDITEEEQDAYYSKIGNVANGMVWDIPLNQKAVWEDGTAIKAKDYVDSMERQLSPLLVNFRADSYYKGNMTIANAESYYKQGRQTVEPAYDYINKDTGAIENDTGFYYIDLGTYTPYVSSVFSNAETDSSFYTVLNQRSSKASNAVELAAQRITHGVAYYLWKFVDHTKADDASDWTEVAKPSDVKSAMFKNQKPIDIDKFDAETVYTTKTLNDSSWGDDSNNMVIYTTDALKADLKTFVAGVGRGGATSKEWAWKLPLFTDITNDDANVPFSDVGIKAKDDYTIRLYLSKSITNLNLKFALSGNWLVNVPLYDKLTKVLPSGSKGTTYATNSTDNYMSYGPYKLTHFEAGKSIVIDKNDKWYGYTDGKHTNQYQMERVNTTIYNDHATAMGEFEKGNLDDMDLTVSDMKKYGQSGRRSTTYESYTQKISFNTDRAKLASRQSGSANKTVLANKDFRTGLSLALDRNAFASAATAGSKGFTGLLNDLYLAHVADGTSYRNTTQGKSVYNAVYADKGGDKIGSTTALAESACGFNYNLGVAYLAKGLEDELASSEDKHLASGNTISIEFRVYDDSSENTINSYNFLLSSWVKALDDAKKVLIADGKISKSSDIGFEIKMVKDEDYYTSASNGGYDMIFSIWGGAAINPYGLMEVYCSSEFTSTCEYGFKGHQDEVNLDIDSDGDGTPETKSFNDWYAYMNDTLNEGNYGDELKEGDADYAEWLAVHNKKLNVLAGLEAGIINRYETIPLVARGTSSLLGFKVENATDTYISLIGYGGIRFMTFNYTDTEWAKFVSGEGGNLSSLYQSYQG